VHLVSFDRRSGWWFLQKIPEAIMSSQQCLHGAAQILIVGANTFQKRGALWNWNLKSLSEND